MRHLSDTVAIRTAAMPVPELAMRLIDSGEQLLMGSYKQSVSLLGSSLVASSPSSRVEDGTLEFSSENSSVQWYRRSGSGKMASSLPGGGFESAALRTPLKVPEVVPKVHNEVPTSLEQSKAKPTKAERRALQKAQRAAKVTVKAKGRKPTPVSGGGATSKPVKQSSQKKEMQEKDTPAIASSVVVSDKKGGDRPTDRRKDVPPPRMQFDDKSRMEKAKRRAMVNQTEAKNRVELFWHMPQYERGTQLPDLESKFFQLDLQGQCECGGLYLG